MNATLLASVCSDIRQGMTRRTAMTRAGLYGREAERFTADHERDMDAAEADYEANLVAILDATLRADGVRTDDVLKVLERRRKAWRSPDTKLREKMGHPLTPQVPALPVKKTRQELLDELDLLDSQLPALAHDEAKKLKP